MPMTLVEAAKLETRNLVRSGVIEQFARTSEILRVLPFENIQGNALAYNREEALPGAGLARDEHARVGARHLARELHDFLHGP